MRRDLWTRGLGIACAIASLPVLYFVPSPLGGALGTALAVIGLFVAIVVAERVVGAASAQSILDGDARALHGVASGLKLAGSPIYVHDQGNVGEERLFLPASNNAKPVPILDAETTTYAGGGGTKLGIALAPSGLRLVQDHERNTQQPLHGADLPSIEAFLQTMFDAGDLARGVRLATAGDAIVFELRGAALRAPCVADPSDPLCAKTGCSLCQAAGCSLARALARPLAVEWAAIDAETIRVTFRAREDLT
ncbi:MAG: hypothetical protein ACYDCK_00855 [Thermoplasmatota archaeon]